MKILHTSKTAYRSDSISHWPSLFGYRPTASGCSMCQLFSLLFMCVFTVLDYAKEVTFSLVFVCLVATFTRTWRRLRYLRVCYRSGEPCAVTTHWRQSRCYELYRRAINQSINQLINQSINQSTKSRLRWRKWDKNTRAPNSRIKT